MGLILRWFCLTLPSILDSLKGSLPLPISPYKDKLLCTLRHLNIISRTNLMPKLCPAGHHPFPCLWDKNLSTAETALLSFILEIICIWEPVRTQQLWSFGIYLILKPKCTAAFHTLMDLQSKEWLRTLITFCRFQISTILNIGKSEVILMTGMLRFYSIRSQQRSSACSISRWWAATVMKTRLYGFR